MTLFVTIGDDIVDDIVVTIGDDIVVTIIDDTVSYNCQ